MAKIVCVCVCLSLCVSAYLYLFCGNFLFFQLGQISQKIFSATLAPFFLFRQLEKILQKTFSAILAHFVNFGKLYKVHKSWKNSLHFLQDMACARCVNHNKGVRHLLSTIAGLCEVAIIFARNKYWKEWEVTWKVETKEIYASAHEQVLPKNLRSAIISQFISIEIELRKGSKTKYFSEIVRSTCDFEEFRAKIYKR